MGFLRLDIIWAVIFSVVNVQTLTKRGHNGSEMLMMKAPCIRFVGE